METYLRYNEAKALTEERDNLRAMLNDPMKGARIEDRPAMERKEREISKRIETTVPPDLTPEQRDKMAKLEKELAEKICVGMPSSEEMRKSPPGALGKHMKHERANKNNILVWKNCRLALNKGDDDPDLANVELLRPRTSSLNMDNAIVPGTSYDIPSEQFMRNYDQISWKGKSPEEMDSEIASLRSEISELRATLRERPQQRSKAKNFSGKCDSCGREFKAVSQAMVGNAIRTHKRSCKSVEASAAEG